MWFILFTSQNNLENLYKLCPGDFIGLHRINNSFSLVAKFKKFLNGYSVKRITVKMAKNTAVILRFVLL